MGKANCYKSVEAPHKYLLNSRDGYICIQYHGKVFTVTLVTTEFYNNNQDRYEEIDYCDFENVWDNFTSKATDIISSAENEVFLVGNRIPDTVENAKNKLKE